MAERQFIVGQKYETLSVFRQFVPGALVRMTQRQWTYPDRPDLERLFAHRLGRYLGLDLAEVHGEEGRGHCFGEEVLCGPLGIRTAVYADLRPFHEDGFEKGESQEVVPVGVGEKKADGTLVGCEQLVPEFSYAGARVDDDDIVVLAPDLDARRIAAVLNVVFP